MIRLIAIILLALVSAAQAQNTEPFNNYMSSRASANSITGLNQLLILQNNQVKLGSVSALGGALITSDITRAAIASSTIAGNTIVTSGYSAPGDAGAGCIYSTVGATGGGLMNINDATGQHWNLVPMHGQADGLGGGFGGELSVGCFGAAQDQTADDTAAVQRGVNWAVNNQGTLYLANDLISSSVTFTAAASTSYLYFNLVGVGQGPTLTQAGSDFPMLVFDMGTTGAFDSFSIRNMSFNSKGAISGTGLTFRGTGNGIAHFILDNLLFANLNIGLQVSNPNGFSWATVSRLRIFNCNYGINIAKGTGTGIVWNDIVMQMAQVATGTGIHMGDGTSNTGDMVWNGITGDGGAYGLDFQGGSVYADYNQIYGFQWNAANNAFVRLRNMVNTVIHGIWDNATWDIDTASLNTDLNLRQQVIEAPLAATQNNYTINPFSRYEMLSATTSLQITGIATPFDGRLVDIYNVSGSTITLATESAASATTNRFHLGANAALASGQGISLRWVNQFNRWIRVGGQ